MGPPWQFVEAVQGANAANATVSTSTATKSGGVAGTYDAEAKSNQTIAADGFVEFRASGIAHQLALGLNNNDTSNGMIDLPYCFVLDPGGGLRVFELNVEKATTTYADNDVLRVERRGTTIYYFKNGEPFYTSATASSAVLFIDSSLASASAVAADIRLYDGTSKTWPALTWTVANVAMSAGANISTRRITFAAPTKMKAGDQLVAVFASQAAESVSATSQTWGFVDAAVATGNSLGIRGLAVYRRIVTGSEPSSYTFDLNVTQDTLGALLVYRGLNNAAAIVGISGVAQLGLTAFACPSRTLTRYSDLYLGIIFEAPSAGAVTPPGDCTERIEFTQSAAGYFTFRLEAFDVAVEAVGATGTKTATMTTSSGAAFSIALSGLPAATADRVHAIGSLGAAALPAGGY